MTWKHERSHHFVFTEEEKWLEISRNEKRWRFTGSAVTQYLVCQAWRKITFFVVFVILLAGGLFPTWFLVNEREVNIFPYVLIPSLVLHLWLILCQRSLERHARVQ